MKKFLLILIPVLVCFGVGFGASQAQESAVDYWYPTLIKSPLSPPNIVFPIVWNILYLFMGISIGLVLISKAADKRFLVTLFCVQLVLNLCWSFLFFKMQNPLWGFFDIVLLDILVILYIVKSYPRHRAASVLFMPYAVWILFASYLNFYIMVHN